VLSSTSGGQAEAFSERFAAFGRWRVDGYAPAMQIEHDGVSLHVAEDGNPDGRPVLFLHGITSCVETWDWALPDLVAEHRVLRLDFRGHGDSARAPGTYGFTSCVADAIAVCEQLIGGPSVVVGHSLGGGTAAALAQLRPDLVSAILLEDPAIMAGDLEVADGEPNALMGAFALLRQMVPMLQESNVTVDAMVGIVKESPGIDGRPIKESTYPDAIAAMARGLLRLDAAVLDPVLAGVFDRVYDAHAPIPVRGIVLAGDEAKPDTIVRAPEKALLAQHSAHLDVRTIAGAGHMIHDSLEHRAAMRAALREVLAGA
jgi:pimeloyl-ACP methyl ester carboxylesterase